MSAQVLMILLNDSRKRDKMRGLWYIVNVGSSGTNLVIDESCYQGTLLQRNYRKRVISW